MFLRNLFRFFLNFTFLLFLTSRLSTPIFKSGFVLQTLNNLFLKNNVITLLTLLNIIGYVIEYLLFVTFLNSIDTYIQKMEELRKLESKL